MGNQASFGEPHQDQAQWLANADDIAVLVRVRQELHALRELGVGASKFTLTPELITSAIQDFGLPPVAEDEASSTYAMVALVAYMNQLGWAYNTTTKEEGVPPTVHGIVSSARGLHGQPGAALAPEEPDDAEPALAPEEPSES